jgi:hypothetical protein
LTEEKAKMSEQTRRKLSLAFTIYNKAVAQARRAGNVKAVEQWNKTLGKLVKDAYRRNRAVLNSSPLPLALA